MSVLWGSYMAESRTRPKLLFIIILFLFSESVGQEASAPLLIHDLVGNKIDKTEREKYVLFPSVDDFYSARFFLKDSNNIVLELQTTEDGKPVSKTLSVSILLLQGITEQINKYLPSSGRTDSEIFYRIETERKRMRELFPGYAGSLFGGVITTLFVYGSRLRDDPSRAEFYLVWGVGSAFFSAAGVQTAGEFDDGYRTMAAGFLGGLAGSAIGILAFEGSLHIENPGVAALIILFGKPLLTSYGAIQGYYSAAKSKYSGAVNLEKSDVRLGIPELELQMTQDSPFIGQSFLTYKLSLLNVAL